MHIRQAEVASLETVGELGVFEAEEMQDRRVQIVNMHLVLRRVVAELTGDARDDSLRSLTTEHKPTDGDQTEQPQPTPKRHDARAVSTPL